jgi:dethiobiotin synthetase
MPTSVEHSSAAAQAGLFITGTDTGVGKTVVAAAIARTLRREGVAVRVCKPVATGTSASSDHTVAEDTRCLAEAAGEKDFEAVTPWAFAAPAAPPVAARFEGVELRLEDLVSSVRRRFSPGGFVLVEGIGGLLCPLTADATVADLIDALAFPVVLVARRSLGTLNHTLLTLEVARRRHLEVCGLVVSTTEPVVDVAAETNVEELRRRTDVPILAVLPYRPDHHMEEFAEIRAVDWRSLAAGRQFRQRRSETEGRGACRQ